MKKHSIMIVLPLVYSFQVSADSICQSFTPVTDKCTFPSAVNFVMPGISSVYADLWSAQCNQHDINYQILGKSKSNSDEELYQDMKDRCDSKFNKYLAVSLNLQCKSIAKGVREALRSIPENDYYIPNQNRIANYYKDISQKVDSQQCKMTAEKAGFVDPAILSTVNQTFRSKANRAPTAYERLRLLALYTPSNHLSTFAADVNYFSGLWGGISGPNVNYVRTSSYSSELILDASTSTGSGLRYRWNLNHGTSNTAFFQKYFSTQYNETFNISGVLEVTDSNNNSDFAIVNETFVSRGECAPRPGYQCL